MQALLDLGFLSIVTYVPQSFLLFFFYIIILVLRGSCKLTSYTNKKKKNTNLNSSGWKTKGEDIINKCTAVYV